MGQARRPALREGARDRRDALWREVVATDVEVGQVTPVARRERVREDLGADVVEAAMACVTGHRMTPDLAAMCLQTYWRRYTSIANYQESRGAAITVQAAFRGMGGRTEARGEQEAMDQALMDAGLIARSNNDEDLYAHKSVTKLQAVWRGHLARQIVDKLRWQSKSKLQRTFSWSKKNKKKPTPEAIERKRRRRKRKQDFETARAARRASFIEGLAPSDYDALEALILRVEPGADAVEAWATGTRPGWWRIFVSESL